MGANTAAEGLGFLLSQLKERLETALGIAKAAVTCSASGNTDKAIEIALDVEQLLYEAETLLNAASLLNRIVQT